METKLINLNPMWLSSGGEGITNAETGEPVPISEHAAIELDCPCGCKERRCIPTEKGHWHIQGNFDFETLTLTPSIQVTTGCKTHFCITDGNIIP